MLPKPVAKEIIALIEEHAQAAVRVHVAGQFTPDTNLELDEKHNAQKVKAALYKLIDQYTAP